MYYAPQRRSDITWTFTNYDLLMTKNCFSLKGHNWLVKVQVMSTIELSITIVRTITRKPLCNFQSWRLRPLPTYLHKVVRAKTLPAWPLARPWATKLECLEDSASPLSDQRYVRVDLDDLLVCIALVSSLWGLNFICTCRERTYLLKSLGREMAM